MKYLTHSVKPDKRTKDKENKRNIKKLFTDILIENTQMTYLKFKETDEIIPRLILSRLI